MAAPEPSRTITADFLFLAAKDTEILAHKTNMIRALVKPPKTHPKIRKITLYFMPTIGEILTDMPYLCETEI